MATSKILGLYVIALLSAALGLGCHSTSNTLPAMTQNQAVMRAFDTGREAWDFLHPKSREVPLDWSIFRQGDSWSIRPLVAKPYKRLKSGRDLYDYHHSWSPKGEMIVLDDNFAVTYPACSRPDNIAAASQIRRTERERLAAGLAVLGEFHCSPKREIAYTMGREGFGWVVTRFVMDFGEKPASSSSWSFLINARRVYLSANGQVSLPLELSLWDLAQGKGFVWEVVNKEAQKPNY